MTPYYADEHVTLWHGSMFDVLPTLGQFDACIADPPYGQTSLAWDRWPDGWVDVVAEHTSSLWCFGTLRMFMARTQEFGRWRMSQDIAWDKGRSTYPGSDRFRRCHETLTHWYQGMWADIYKDLPCVPHDGPRRSPVIAKNIVTRSTGHSVYGGYKTVVDWRDNGTRYMGSVLRVPTLPTRWRARHAINPTQKPVDLLEPLIQYSIPEGGVVLDPFAGSGSTGIAARNLGRRAVLIEAREEQCESTAKRLASEVDQGVLDIGAVS